MLPRIIEAKINNDQFSIPILLLGRCGENLATKVVIDVSEWQDGSGTFQLLVKRADEEMFTATIEQDNGVVTWLIPAAEIGAAGYGEIELNYLVGEATMKSARVDTRVFSSIEIDSLPPNGTTWSQLVLAAVQDARAASEGVKRTQNEIDSTISDAVASATSSAKNAAQYANDAANRAGEIAKNIEASLCDAVSDATRSASAFSDASASSASSSRDSASSASQSASNAANSAAEASGNAGKASAAKKSAESARDEAKAARDEILDVLNNATILDTTETVTFNDDGLVDTIVHTSNGTGIVVRTDVFTYNGSVVTEVRTAADGRIQTNVYDLESLSQQFNV